MTTPEKTPHLYRIFSSPEEINQQVDSALVEGLSAHFPIESKQYRLEAENFRAEPKQFSMKDEKDAILRSKSLTYPIKADLKLIDKSTGEVVAESKGFSLMDSFGLTSKHTVVYKGNNYSISNQLQLRPGVYTRSRETGELESHFNTGTGRSFSLTLDPQTGLFYVNVGSSNILASPLISKVFGVGVTEASKYVPKEVWNDNLTAASGKETKILGDLYKRLVSTSKQQAGASPEVMAVQLKESLLNSQLSIQTTAETLGKPLGSVTHDAILLAMRNLIEVHARRRPEDNRDSLQFKRVQNLPDFLRTRFNKEHQVVRSVKTKIARDMDRMPKGETSMRNILASKPFNKFFSNYLVNSNLASTPSETNPIESIENVAKVTVLGAGEGGISDERAVPMSARDIDPSHLGIIDPSRTPESGHAGIDQRFTVTARRDAEGNLYARVKDNSGAVKYLNVQQMVNSVIGFPGQDGKDPVQAQIRGNLGQCKRSEVNYWLGDVTDMYTVTTNLVPFLNSNHPGRLTMAGKAIPQALSLVDREAPLVQTTNDRNMSLVKGIGQVISTKSPVDGVITEISGRTVKIKDEAGRLHKVEGVKNLPFNMKGFLDDEKLLVKEGDKVSAGTPIFDNNYTQNGVLSLGKNLNVAYIPYKGYNHEDGLVLRQGAADKLSSHHAYKIDYAVQETSVMKKSLIQRYFPGRFTKEQLEKLDDHGFAKVGSKLAHGDPVYIVLERRTLTPEDKMLGRLHKSLVNPYRPAVEYWTHEEVGEVVDAHTESKDVRILVRSIKPLDIGDKLTGLHGNKGIVSLILPDEKMPYSAATGKPVDILLNPASVTSRVNLGQLMETAAGKIAQHTGTPYLVHNFSKESNVKNLSEELAKHGLSDSEELIDPTTGKSMPKVLTGPQYFLKLYKTSDQNWSARNVGSYDNTLQPTKGGEEGSKSVGFMEMLGLLGSDARHNLKEIATLKAQENTEYWSKFLKGQPLPKPNTTFATQKFLDYLTGAGIKTSINNGKITISPMTDRDVLSISHGEIKTPSMLSAKDLEPERGGLFDPVLTGGLRGTKWTHYKLAEAIPHPVMEKPIKSVLGLSTKEFEGIAGGSLAVNRVSRGVFNLHDVSTGKVVKTVNISDVKLEEPEIENDHHD